MTEQHRCDSMADAMVPYGPPTANEHLRHAMRRDEWSLLPVEPVKPRRNYGWMIWPALVLGLAACVAIASI